MSRNVYISFCLAVALLLVSFYSETRQYFSGRDTYEMRLVEMQKIIQKERFKTLLSYYNTQEFKQDVAQILPEAIKTEKQHDNQYQLRNLASIVTANESDQLPLQLAKNHFEKARRMFSKGKYLESNLLFQQFIRRFPFSVKMPEAYFLLAEGHFQVRHFDNAISVVETMIELFPSHELTGFAMLRMGKVFEYQDRPGDAAEIYKTVLASFPYPEVAKQSRLSMQAIEL